MNLIFQRVKKIQKNFNLNNELSPKEFNLGDVTIQDKNSSNKSNEKIPSLKLFSTPDVNN